MLKHRLLMSAILIPATITLFTLDHYLGDKAPILLVILLAISTRCVWELVTLARAAGFRPSFFLCCLGTWSTILGGWMSHGRGFSQLHWYWERATGNHPIALLAIISAALLVNAVGRYPIATVPPSENKDLVPRLGLNLGTVAVELFTLVYIGLLLMETSRLRWIDHGSKGYFAIGALVVATKMGDVGAYTFGRLIGGPKMVPQLSPAKTWSGGVGHLVTAGLCSAAWLSWIGPRISDYWHAWEFVPAVIFGVIVGFAGLIGDLVESLIKRDVGVKDAPALFPGFGGLLDLMDSLLLAGPVAYWLWPEVNWFWVRICDWVRQVLL